MHVGNCGNGYEARKTSKEHEKMARFMLEDAGVCMMQSFPFFSLIDYARIV